MNGWDEFMAGPAFAVCLRHQAAGTLDTVEASYEAENAAHAVFDAKFAKRGIPNIADKVRALVGGLPVPPPRSGA